MNPEAQLDYLVGVACGLRAFEEFANTANPEALAEGENYFAVASVIAITAHLEMMWDTDDRA